MSEYFALHFAGPPFASLGAAHLATLVFILTIDVGLIWIGRAVPAARSLIRIGLAIAIWSAESAWHIWNVVVGTWSMQTMLPLNTCSILIWLSGLMLIRKEFRIYEFAYFLGIGGAIQYLATPDLGQYGFPHFRFFQAFASHGLLLTAPVYMTLVEDFRPTWNSLKTVVIGTNLYMIVIYLVNVGIGSNYLMLNGKPSTPSLLDILPRWPYYLPYMELIGLLSCVLLYLPFSLAARKQSKRRLTDRPA